MTRLRKLISVAGLAGFFLIAAAPSAQADMIGLAVDGELNFFGGTNWFDPANGFVPAGFLNVAGTSVIIGAADEFGFDDTANRDTAVFTANQLIIQDQVLNDGGINNPITMIFTAPWLIGATVAEVADSFPSGGLTALLAGDTLTVTWAGSNVLQGDSFRGIFDVTPGREIPEPATLLLIGSGLVAAGLRRRNRTAR